MEKAEANAIDKKLGISSPRTLGEIELFLPAGSNVDGLAVMNGTHAVAGTPLVPLEPKDGDRVIVVFRTGGRI